MVPQPATANVAITASKSGRFIIISRFLIVKPLYVGRKNALLKFSCVEIVCAWYDSARQHAPDLAWIRCGNALSSIFSGGD
jgi:hypothetical protein